MLASPEAFPGLRWSARERCEARTQSERASGPGGPALHAASPYPASSRSLCAEMPRAARTVPDVPVLRSSDLPKVHQPTTASSTDNYPIGHWVLLSTRGSVH